MRTRHIAVVLMGGVIAAAAMSMESKISADESRKPDNTAAMVHAADGALRATMAQHAVGKATVEDVYQWSRRLMSAEQRAGKADAVLGHLQRMRTLYEKTAALYKTGSRGGSENDYYASKFYFLEAEANDAN